MGWYSDDALGHEGWPVGLIAVDGEDLYTATHFVELQRPRDRIRTGVHHAQAGCECGWRSQRIVLSKPVTWDDGWLECSEHDRARMERLWNEHAALVAYRLRMTLEMDRYTVRARINEALISSLESTERCACGHDRREHEGRPLGLCNGGGELVRCPCKGFTFRPTPA